MKSKPSPKSTDVVISDELTEVFALADGLDGLVQEELIEIGVISIHKPLEKRRHEF